MIYSGIISSYGPVIVTLKYFDNNQYCLCNIKTTLVIIIIIIIIIITIITTTAIIIIIKTLTL